MKRSSGVRCFGIAWVLGWAVAIYLPSVLIAWDQLGGRFDLRRLLADTWHVADAMAPGAKLMLGGLMLVGFLAADRFGRNRRVAVVLGAVAGAAALLLTLLLLPAEWSRGFGIGLTGERLPRGLLPFYLGGAAVAGVFNALSVAACRAKLGEA
ncbi:hypothetical protein LQ953_05950 [Sphingomonas sp. IC-56]|uniref:hypothetical protein n=1 Tax=Sphingomonas sp. IC-56 TaxID=2898529 RepID=UPI001E5BCF53|nr:hypothetical protein [Sphingomonas sp. IC-56]MCD2323557.1 hypothetical protein [Sphingomonas sp. IC-56]